MPDLHGSSGLDSELGDRDLRTVRISRTVALQKVQELGIPLDEQSRENCSFDQSADIRSFSRLDLLGVVHSYHNEQDDSSFVLGPINLSFEPGELVFVVGGNGSGKSTLAKLIAGLY